MLIEFSSDSEVWLKVKHALHESGQRFWFQQNLFDKARVTLFLEPMPEPAEGKLVSGMIVYQGGSGINHGFSMDSRVFAEYQKETTS